LRIQEKTGEPMSITRGRRERNSPEWPGHGGGAYGGSLGRQGRRRWPPASSGGNGQLERDQRTRKDKARLRAWEIWMKSTTAAANSMAAEQKGEQGENGQRRRVICTQVRLTGAPAAAPARPLKQLRAARARATLEGGGRWQAS